ncbi:MAG: hypothetical protein Q8O99_06990 [bacterium]|nr:hypothetical protein [bacterium]
MFDITNEQAQKLHKNYPTLFPTGIDAKQLTRDLAGHLCQLKK